MIGLTLIDWVVAPPGNQTYVKSDGLPAVMVDEPPEHITGGEGVAITVGTAFTVMQTIFDITVNPQELTTV